MLFQPDVPFLPVSPKKAVERFVQHLTRRDKSAETIRCYLSELRRFAAFAGDTPLPQVDEDLIRRYLSHCIEERKNSPRSIAWKQEVLRHFFKFAVKDRLVPRNPALLLGRMRWGVMIPDPIPTKQVNLMVDQAGRKGSARRVMGKRETPGDRFRWSRDRLIFELLYGTGVRVGELVGMDIEDFDLKDRWVRVRATKTKTERDVPYGTKAARAMEAYLRARRWFLLERRRDDAATGPRPLLVHGGKRITTRSVERIVKKYCGSHPHAFRHAFATDLSNAGVDLRVLQELLGHSSISNTAVYLNVAIDKLVEIHARCHPLGNRTAKETEKIA